MRIHERSCMPLGMLALVAFGAANAETAYRASVEYDELGRVTRSLNAAGQVVERHAYDAVGNRTSTTDALGRTTTYAYDAHNRIVETVDPTGARTRFAYDAADRLTQVTDPRGLVTTYVYDGLGQLLREVSPDRGVIAYDYTGDGVLQRKTFADGQSLDHEYDALGRLVRQGNAIESRTYRYDTCANGKGRLCGADTADTTLDLGYTQQGQIEYKVESVAGQSHETLFAWDAMGRMVGLGYPSGVYIGYQYEEGALKGVHARIAGQTMPVVTHIAHQPFGQASAWWHGNGLMRTQHIDLDGRLMGIGVASGSATRQSLTYQRSAANEITKVTNGLNAALTQAFAYDSASRLISADFSGQNVDFTYDTNGNRTLHKANALSMHGVFDPNSNRLTSVTGDKTSYLNYDINGNRTHVHHVWDHIGDYSYDGFQRLSAAHYRDGNGSSTTYLTTNALDQRVSKSGPSGTTRFTYLGQNQLLGEAGANGWRDYIWMGDTLVGMVGADRKLRHVHTDHVGRPEAVTDAAGQAVWRANNYAFERIVSLDQIGGLNIGFPGQYWDAEFKLWFNGFRYYDSNARSSGRYTQPDPLGLAAGTNPYGYVHGNPLLYVDPFGLFCISTRMKAALSGAAGGAATGFFVGGLAGAAGGAALGGAVSYAFAEDGVGRGAAVGGIAGGYATGTTRGAMVGAITGGFAGAEGGALIAGTMGGIEAGASVSRSAARSTRFNSFAGPVMKGAKGGAIGWAASAATQSLVDGINATWGDCGCGQ